MDILQRRFVCLLFFLCTVGVCFPPVISAAMVREPVWAGRFYPAEKSSLVASITQYSRKAARTRLKDLPAGTLKALVLPHAGYVYSGWTAAHASHVLAKGDFSRVILMGPDHRVGIRNAAISDMELFRSPLGFIKLDAAGEMLCKKSTLFKIVPAVDKSEHSLEVILPFLQYYIGGFSLVPIVLGRKCDSDGIAGAVSTILDDDTLLVVSTDLSHYLPYDEAVAKDRRTLESVMTLQGRKLADEPNSACGIEGLRVLLKLAGRFGWKPQLLHYSNSGDTAGDRKKVVGYAAIAFFGDGKMVDENNDSGKISQEQGRILVKLARQTIHQKLTGKTDPVSDAELERALADPVFRSRRGVFVTLHKDEKLRGCIGSLNGFEPIVEGVRRNALNAAFQDTRFLPVTGAEWDDIDLEVSVLTDPKPFSYKDSLELVRGIRPKVDGLIIRKGMNSATFLPQVWDQLPEPEIFLSQLCRKAGLPSDEWKYGQLEVMTYQVQYFAEDE